MKKQRAGLIFLFLFPLSLFSQKNLLGGYVVTIGGDTLRGRIDYKNKGRNPEHISFLKEGTTSFTDYKPADISCFAVADELFFSKTVAYDVSSDNPEELSMSTSPVMKTGRFFLSAYVLGTASLYYLNDATGKEHFFIEKDTSLRELIHNKYQKIVDGVSYTVESDRYKQQLLVNMADCAGLAAKIDQLSFTVSSLIMLFNTYNSCKNTVPLFIKKQEHIKFTAGILLGASVTKLRFHSSVQPFARDINYKASADVAAGLALTVILPRNRQSWSVYNSLLYKHYRATAVAPEIRDDPNDIVTNTFLFDFSYIRLFTMLRYQYPGKKIKPYINAGISNGYAIKNKSTQTVDEKLYGNHIHYTENVFSAVKTYNQGFAAGIGMECKKFNAELRYETDNGISKSAFVRSLTNSGYFLVGYSF